MHKRPVVISSVIIKETGFGDYRFIAKLAAESLNYEVILNDEDPGTRQSDFFDILNKQRPIVIAIFGGESSETVIEECKMALDNHLHIIPLFKVDSETAEVPKEVEKIISQISLPMFMLDCHKFCNGEQLYNNIVEFLDKYQRRLQAPEKLSSRHNSIYVKALELLKSSRREFILCQKTSTLLLGARAGQDDEYRFYEGLKNWLINENRMYSDSNMTFKHIFSLKETQANMGKNKYDIAKARENLDKILNKNTQMQFELIDIDWESNYMPFVISDGDLLVNLFFTDIEFNVIIKRQNIELAALKSIPSDIGRNGNILYQNKHSIYTADKLLADVYGGRLS